MIYLGLNAGGYFADTTGWAAAALAVLLAVRLAVSGGTFIGTAGWRLIASVSSLGLFALWTLLSGSWSGNHGRALLEFDRALLYLLVLLVFGSIARPRVALRFLPWGFAVAAVALCAIGLATKTFPDAWPFSLPALSSRLAYPVTYSNGLGLLAALGITACLHLASWERERLAVRIAAATMMPLLAATLVLTFSRGGILVAIVGVVVYGAVARPRGLVTAAVALAGPVALASWAAYDAELLATRDPLTAASIAQGHSVARTVGIAMLGAGVLLGLLQLLEPRLAGLRIPRPPRALVVLVAVAVAVAAVVVVGPRVVDSFNQDAGVGLGSHEHEREPAGATRDRLADVGGQTRVQYWKVSLAAFDDEPIIGTGVGTFAQRWDENRPFAENVTEGHSVLIETLGELGLVGAALIVATLTLMIVAFVVPAGDPRPLRAVGLAAGVVWLMHACIDWDWELPVLTVGLFAFGGCVMAGSAARSRAPGRPSIVRRLVLGGACLLVVLTPVTIAISQSDLDRSVAAIERDDCAEATRLAEASRSALSVRSEPYEILAYCASRSGAGQDAVTLMNMAIDRDQNDWQLYYGLALVRAAAGEDPRPAAARALRLNPLEPLTQMAVRRLSGDDPREWQRRAQSAPLPL